MVIGYHCGQQGECLPPGHHGHFRGDIKKNERSNQERHHCEHTPEGQERADDCFAVGIARGRDEQRKGDLPEDRDHCNNQRPFQ